MATALRWFVLGPSAAVIAEQARLERKRVLRALLLVRQAMARDILPVFSGVVDIDEIYVGGRRRNQRREQRAQAAKPGRGTTKQPVFAILARGGQVWAEVVPDVAAETLLPLLQQRVKTGSVVWTDAAASYKGPYTGLATRGYIHRIVDHRLAFSDHRGGHINGLEGFWSYLKRRLAAKGGIRRHRLPLYLAEYVWRYNHRHLSLKDQANALLKLLRNQSGGGQITLPLTKEVPPRRQQAGNPETGP